MAKEQIRKEIIRCGNLLIKKGLVTGTGGNISARIPAEKVFYITPSGIPYEEIAVDDIVVIDFDGNVISGKRKPSIESILHRYIYIARPDVNAVIHTHAVYTSAIAATRQDLPPFLDTLVAVFGGGLKTAGYASIGTEKLAQNAVEALGTRSAALLANHGAVCTGQNLAQAFDRAEFLEASAKTYIMAHLIGKPVTLDQGVIDKEAADLVRRYGQN
ncbi:MAG: class II aldolase/adducin family protein [bacterium]|jgi:L-fuculose-phosphate aldolase